MSARTISYKNHRFPPQIIAHAVWLYFWFPLSLRLAEEMLLERSTVVSYETIRRWGRKFGAAYAKQLRRKRPSRPRHPRLIALFGARWLRPVRRSRLYTAVRRAVAVYLFIETVPITVCLLLVAIFNVGQSVGLTFWVVSMMGVIFSGPVLLVFISLALTLDWVVSLLRRPWRSMRR